MKIKNEYLKKIIEKSVQREEEYKVSEDLIKSSITKSLDISGIGHTLNLPEVKDSKEDLANGIDFMLSLVVNIKNNLIKFSKEKKFKDETIKIESISTIFDKNLKKEDSKELQEQLSYIKNPNIYEDYISEYKTKKIDKISSLCIKISMSLTNMIHNDLTDIEKEIFLETINQEIDNVIIPLISYRNLVIAESKIEMKIQENLIADVGEFDSVFDDDFEDIDDFSDIKNLDEIDKEVIDNNFSF
jgi:hypothetical protein